MARDPAYAFRLDSDTNQQLDDIARGKGQNRSETVRQLIRDASEKQNKK